MSDMDYVYAVARIRSKELSLFSDAVMEQLLARPDYEACVSFLLEKGWGGKGKRKDLGGYSGTDAGYVCFPVSGLHQCIS